MSKLKKIFKNPKPIIGMVHLRPLPGSPRYSPTHMGMKEIIAIAKEEAKIFEDAGVDGVQVENMWDIPYLLGKDIGPETTAALAVGVYEVSQSVSIPVGAECHMNGADIALAAAVAGGAKWIRIFEWCNAFISQSGYVESVGGKIARMRTALQADDIACFCDVNVKHGSHFIIHDRSVEEQAMDVEAQDGDAVIVTGFDTGEPPSADRIIKCKEHISLPVLLGSGTTHENVAELLLHADGAIVGSYFKKNGNWKNTVDSDRVRLFMKSVTQLRKEIS
ncbi:MAG: BtpA/SgcQ family protein [Clostridiales bacterium]|nr:BtpA/SgcQ family protein [Clostridiales bacterium]